MATDAFKPEEYRRQAEACWDHVIHAGDLETKAVYEFTAAAWEKLAEQVETLENPV